MQERVWNALKEVMDPEYPISIVDLGLVKDVSISEGKVTVKVTFTSTGCPCMEWIINDVKEAVIKVAGVEEVHVEIVWSKPWTSNDLTDEARKVMKSLNTAI
jgi:metal-sulfur cluster biosynthetic enzyme